MINISVQLKAWMTGSVTSCGGLWLKVKYFDKKPYHDDRPYVRWDDVELVVADLLEEEKKKVKNSKNKGVIVNGCAGSIEDRILGTGGTGTVPVDPPRGRLKE